MVPNRLPEGHSLTAWDEIRQSITLLDLTWEQEVRALKCHITFYVFCINIKLVLFEDAKIDVYSVLQENEQFVLNNLGDLMLITG